MPIRFRCAYCNQLMGIGRRKAGTVVNCPKCQGQVVVPQPEVQEAPGPSGEMPNLFEDAPLEPFLGGGGAGAFQAGAQVAAPEAPPAAPTPQAPPAPWAAYDPYPMEPMPRGIFLTPGLFTLVCVLVVLLMGLAFFLGLLLGRTSGEARDARQNTLSVPYCASSNLFPSNS